MKVEAGPPGQIVDSGTPHDLIVGTIHPPALFGRIAARAWLFVGFAAVDVAFRTWEGIRTGASFRPATDVATLIVAAIIGAGTVLLPAAMLLGRRGSGHAELRVLQGGIALATAELVGLVGPRVVEALAGLSVPDGETLGLVIRSSAVQGPLVLLRVLGLVQIGRGLGLLAPPPRPLGRVVLAVLVVTVAFMVADDLLTIQAFQAVSVPDTLLLAYDVVVLASGIVVVALWASVASIAARHADRTWRLIAAGALAVVLGSGIRATADLFGLSQAFMANAFTILTWSRLAALAVGAFGVSLLLVGFAAGFGPIDAPQSADATRRDASDPDSVARPADS